MTKRARAMAARAMAMTTRVAGDKEGNSDGDKSDGNDEKGGGRATAMAAKRVIVTAIRLVGE